MKLLLFSVPEKVDEALMLVPDAYDEAYAKEEAAAFLDAEPEALVIEFEADVDDQSAASLYRPYVG